MNPLEIFSLISGVLGSLLVPLKSPKKRLFGFSTFIVNEITMIILLVVNKQYLLVLLQIVFFISSLIGIKNSYEELKVKIEYKNKESEISYWIG